MIYVYDILLNFNKDLIEFFEWLDTDNIKYAKKITLFKINSKSMNDLLKNEIEFDDSFIKNTLRYEFNGNLDKINYTLFSDGKIVLGVLIRNKKIDMVSRLIIDEEDEIIDMIKDIDCFNISYKIIKKKVFKNDLVTREQLKIKNLLKKEIDKLFLKKEYSKLRYLYYEITGIENNDINYIYNYFLSNLDNITEVYNKLINILELSSKKSKNNI